MDSLDSDQERLFKTLQQFRLINRLLTPCHRLITRHFLSPMRSEPERTWTLLDIGSGGGDLVLWITRRCQALGLKIQVTCMDHDPRVIEFLQRRCDAVPNIDVVHADATDLHHLSSSRWDFVFANHFLHHLCDEELVPLLAAIDQAARVRYVLSDLCRSRFSYLAYSSLLPLRWTNSFAWHDGRISIRKAFTLRDGKTFLRAAGLREKASVQRFFPGHLAIIGSP